MIEKLSNPQKTIEIIQKYEFAFQKKFGQNFLIDAHVLEKIIAAADITKEDFVLEIGPGIGTMTQYLAEAAREVVAVEIDRALIPILGETLSAYSNVTVINEDILKVDIRKLAEEKNGGRPIKVVANLPYYITTPIIMGLFESGVPIDSITVMVQKEVAERLTAKTGTRLAGAITYAVEYYSDATSIIKVPKESFVPSPKVESEVIKLKVRKGKKIQVKDEKLLFNIISKSFMQRRKTLSNVLTNNNIMHSKEDVKNMWKELEIDENVRGESLTLEQFGKIADYISEKK